MTCWCSLPTREGYTFCGYYNQANGEGTEYYTQAGESARNWNIAEDTTLYAHWAVQSYTVTFNKTFGAGGTNSVTVTYDSAMPDATMPTREGYLFVGYYDSYKN